MATCLCGIRVGLLLGQNHTLPVAVPRNPAGDSDSEITLQTCKRESLGETALRRQNGNEKSGPKQKQHRKY